MRRDGKGRLALGQFNIPLATIACIALLLSHFERGIYFAGGVALLVAIMIYGFQSLWERIELPVKGDLMRSDYYFEAVAALIQVKLKGTATKYTLRLTMGIGKQCKALQLSW
jgi:hypothetical protein